MKTYKWKYQQSNIKNVLLSMALFAYMQQEQWIGYISSDIIKLWKWQIKNTEGLLHNCE